MEVERLKDILKRTPVGGLVATILRKLYESGIDIPRETDVTGFWDRTGTHYMQDQSELPEWKKQGLRVQEKALVTSLRSLRFGSVLEVGCGYGRILRLIHENFDAVVAGVDLSGDQLRNAVDYLKNQGISLSQQSAGNLGFPDGTFDLVLTCNVLLHVPPRRLDAVLKELLRVSRAHIVLIEPYKGDNRHFRKAYCWEHDYQVHLLRHGAVHVKQQKFLMQEIPEPGYNRIIHVVKEGSVN